jgi:hypothetical protein
LIGAASSSVAGAWSQGPTLIYSRLAEVLATSAGAIRRGAQRPVAVVGDLHSLPFATGSFDVLRSDLSESRGRRASSCS